MSESEKITFQNVKFGEVTIERGAIVTFAQGIPGFERFRQYGLVTVEEEDPFLRLLSIEEPSVGFVIINPMLIWTDYDPDIIEEDVDGLEITRAEEMALYCIVTLSAIPEEVTANLKGPICINTETMKGKQMILVDDRYHTKHAILAVDQKQP